MPTTVETTGDRKTPMADQKTDGRAKSGRRGPNQPKTKKPLKPCGALTRQCECGHHKREHAGRTGRCWTCGEKCEAFKATTCKVVIGLSRETGRCRNPSHRGTKPGWTNPAWKHGRSAAVIGNVKLKNAVYAALSDPTLMKLNADIAIQTGLIEELTSQLKANKPLTDRQRRELVNLMDARRRTIEASARIERNVARFIPVPQFVAWMAMLVQVLRKNVTDLELLKGINAELQHGTQALLASATAIDGEVIEDDDAAAG